MIIKPEDDKKDRRVMAKGWRVMAK